MTIERIGHGAGEDREGPMPNVLRAVAGREGGFGADRVVALETNLDDLVPEHFDYLMERLFEGGALDVSIQHLQMKKNRPGFLVRVLARPSDRLPLARILFAESTAIGVRASELDRVVLDREERRVVDALRPRRREDRVGRGRPRPGLRGVRRLQARRAEVGRTPARGGARGGGGRP